MSVINPLGKDKLKRFGNLMILFFPPMSQIDPLTMACKPLIMLYCRIWQMEASEQERPCIPMKRRDVRGHQAGDMTTGGSEGGGEGGALRRQRTTLKRSPSIWMFIEPCCSSMRLFAMDSPRPLPSV